ncbi:MAG: helicase domain-containing protein [Parcubacteria group bacterium Gr01-1014_38]|nr:MAG: helicase domain-containing protein [Parcubacteria group bacterium Gr01-1014_38]
MNTDLTFITNEKGQSLKERFEVLIRDTKFFDALVGYFYTSGFHALYKPLENTQKIRILIGIGTSKQTLELIEQSRQKTFELSHAETKQVFSDLVAGEMSTSEDNRHVEEGVRKFTEWLRSGKLEIRAYPAADIHAKVYIMSFAEGDRDAGRVITGSSNFTQAGLVENLEFNVELKNRADYEFAKQKFEELWKDAVDVREKYLETITSRTWLNDTVTPYQLYLKFLYEYFKDELRPAEDMLFRYIPSEFKRLEYQEQAVLNAKKILDEYGGAFLSDVVGLGKTYMAAMLASQLDGRTLVIAPPVLLEKANPGSWPSVFPDFRVAADYESLGKLDHLLKRGIEKYQNVFIDEAHRFRTESNVTYEKLARICRGKRVVLVTATPYNNSPKDVLSQIKLFQTGKRSTIPNVPDLESFFSRLEKRVQHLDRQRDRDEYLLRTKENAREIREKVLKYLMVRRTRREIELYFGEDLKRQNLQFPTVSDPEPVFYELNEDEDVIFSKTIEFVAKQFTYARYTPLLYFKGDVPQVDEQGQINMGKFMKILLVKRLESSFHAFRNTVDRFLHSYEQFLRELERGHVYVSKKYIHKIFELIDEGDEEEIQRLLGEDKAQRYTAADFRPQFKKDLEHDLALLREIRVMWQRVTRDPKLLTLVELLSTRSLLKKSKLILFTESKETAEYIAKHLEQKFSGEILLFTGASSALVRERVIENFDARARFPKDDYRLLITTEVLSEGVNLHRSNVVLNYDIPWNPTRLMQRVGRINRVDTAFNTIHAFNFFPTRQAEDAIKLRAAAEAKIHAFISLLGSDARLLTDGEPIESHELFSRLVTKETITGEREEEESELKYLRVIRDIRDREPDLFDQIKRLPKKARTARKHTEAQRRLITYFRKSKLQKFFAVDGRESTEQDFLSAARLLEATPRETRESLGPDFYELLEKNRRAFELATIEEGLLESQERSGRDSATNVLKILRAIKDQRQFTEEQEEYLKLVMKRLELGAVPKQTTKKVFQQLSRELKHGINPLKLLAVVQQSVPREFLESHRAESAADVSGPREVILSEYFTTTR